jgi:hypothetical protein
MLRSTIKPGRSDRGRGGLKCVAGWMPGMLLAWGLILVGSAMTGCTKPEKHYAAENPDEPVPIATQDLGLQTEALKGYGRKDLDPGPKVTRFPTGISVVRVTAERLGDDDGLRHLRVAPMTTESTVMWMHLWDDLPQVREVTELRTLSQDPRGTDRQTLLAASRRIDCELCVMYAQIEDTEADAEFVAVLWDAVRDRPLSIFRIPAVLPDKVREDWAKAAAHDRWSTEAEFRAEADLRQAVAHAVWDLAARDQPSTAAHPNPWSNYDNLPVLPPDLRHWRRSSRGDQGEQPVEPKPAENNED